MNKVLVKFDWSKLQVGSPLYNTAKEALQFDQREPLPEETKTALQVVCFLSERRSD